jgi:hypothetical protein
MSKFKFKVGDKVRMNSFEAIKTNGYASVRINSHMEKLVGKEGIIMGTENCHGVLRYHVDAGDGWFWPESALTLVEDKNQFKPGDKVNVSHSGNRWTDDNELYYVGMNRKGEYVIENEDGIMTWWEYCRPFEEKITYNVWKYQDSDTLLAIKENTPKDDGKWTMVHTFTI